MEVEIVHFLFVGVHGSASFSICPIAASATLCMFSGLLTAGKEGALNTCSTGCSLIGVLEASGDSRPGGIKKEAERGVDRAADSGSNIS